MCWWSGEMQWLLEFVSCTSAFSLTFACFYRFYTAKGDKFS